MSPAAGGMNVRELVDLLGLDSAMLLCQRLGGRRFYFPKSGPHEPPPQVIDAIGADAAQALERHYRSTPLDVPLANRDVAIWLAGKGYTVGEIAGRLRVPEASVRRWIS